MKIDEYGEGFPVAWCISNREDQSLLLQFYGAIKNRVGPLSPKWFMLDFAEPFYSAWLSIFPKSSPPNRLLCTWHVDRAWRKHIEQLPDNQLKISVYHNLRVLIEETNYYKFELFWKELYKVYETRLSHVLSLIILKTTMLNGKSSGQCAIARKLQ